MKDPYHNFKSTIADSVMGIYELPDGSFMITAITDDSDRLGRREFHLCEESVELLRDMLTDCLDRRIDKGM